MSRSGYYAWRHLTTNKKPQPCQLTGAVKRIFNEHKGRYGSPRVHAQLAREGIRVGKRRVERIMRDHGMVARKRRKRTRTIISDPRAAVAPNILNRDFSTTGPNQKWVTDLTYIATAENNLYLALLQDLYSGRIVGWAVDDSMDTDVCLQALRMAIEARKPLAGLIHHSDRGSQYTSRAYRAELEQNGIICSMSRRAQCWDNAPAESIFGRIKEELFPHRQWVTRAEAQESLAEYLQSYFTAKRIKKSLGFCSPIDFEMRHGLMPLAA